MGGGNMFEKSRFGKSRGLILTLACVAVLAGGCNESKPEAKADTGAFDASRLPRVSGASQMSAIPTK